MYNINNRIKINFGNLLFQLTYNITKQVRNIETNEKKLIQANMAVVFNNTCINENLMATFTNINTRLFMNNIMFIIRAGFIRYSVVNALEVIRSNRCLVMNKEFNTNARSNYICKIEVSDRFRQGSLFRDVFFLFLSSYFSVDDGIYSAEESCI